MNKIEINKIEVHSNISIKQALKRLDETSYRVLFVVDQDGMLKGSLSDGDIRRSLLSGVMLDDSIEKSYNPRPITISIDDFSLQMCKEIFLKSKILLIPILDKNGKLVDVVSWDEAFGENAEEKKKKEQIDVPVVIMAGGKGTRLAPFTNVLPKPLIPVGDRTILEIIIDSFKQNGICRFYFTLNYKGEMIKAYFDSIERDYSIGYIWEKEFLGTAGGLAYLKDALNETFIVSNCDIIVKADYADVIRFHKKNNASLTILSSIQHITIPYGVIEYRNGGKVSSITEKPEFSFTVNTGVYIVEPECLKLIRTDGVFHMTNLIESLLRAGKTVLTYPVNNKDYIDIGQWDEYQKNVNALMVKS